MRSVAMYHLYRGGSVESFRKNNICTTTDFYIKCSDMPQVKAQTHRTQLENRVSARRRLAELLEAQLPLVGYKTWTIQPVARLQSGRALGESIVKSFDIFDLTQVQETNLGYGNKGPGGMFFAHSWNS